MEVRAELEAAAAERALVRVTRTIRRSDAVEGFVVGIGQEWVLLAVLDESIFLDGYAALRLGDIRKVRRTGGPRTFVGRVLAARHDWPPTGVDVDLDSVEGLLRTATDVAPLLTLHVEEDHPGACFIGLPVRFTARSVQVLGITAEAEWEDLPGTWEFSEVTRVEFGGRYEEALALVGGTPPAPASGGGEPSDPPATGGGF